MIRLRLTFSSGIAGTILLLACARPPRAHQIDIRAFKYTPAVVVARPGDTLVFTNYDVVPHTAAARDHSWDTGAIASQASARIVVQRSGEYICAFHPTMTATVEVK